MELLHELFLTVAITVVFTFALSKIFLSAAGGGGRKEAAVSSTEKGGRAAVGESVAGRLEVLDDVEVVGGGCGEKTVEVGGIAADMVDECVEGEGSSEEREKVGDDVDVGLEERLVEEGLSDGKTVEVSEIAAAELVECVEGEKSSGKREAVGDDVDAGLENRLVEGGCGEKTSEVAVECVEGGVPSEKWEAIVDDVDVGLENRLVEGGCGEAGEIGADLVEEFVEKREPIEDDVAVLPERRLTEEGCGDKMVEACGRVGGVEAHLIEGYAEDEGRSEKGTVGLEERLMEGGSGEETVDASDGISEVAAVLVGGEGCSGKIANVVELEETLMKGDCAEETAGVSDGVSEVGADLVGDGGGCLEKMEKNVELGETLMKGDCADRTVEAGEGADEVKAISVHECVDQEGNSENCEAAERLESEVKDEVGDEGADLSDDDWEGIQRTDLDGAFAAAAAFVSSEKNADRILNLSSDVKMHLYGLHKVATEGPCQEPPPMALKITARAKWNAWQRLGDMSPEAAMEQYVALLSRDVPGWSEDDPHTQGHRGS